MKIGGQVDIKRSDGEKRLNRSVQACAHFTFFHHLL